ncbi:MAG TPA: TIGR03560 family F420-dependent LLM class oxidoreductase [Gaiellaceae bacterium]|nr:TIGR03560 family F420-dependent LLM class oxidoreductase [Gaiellaceae bacterium]
MRLCLMVEGQEGVTWDEWTALAAACERSGLDGLFRSDHYFSVIGRRDRVSHDALATLAALAARTERIRLGTLVSPVTFRHPSVLAKTVATIDLVSGGRVELGLGAGWNEREHAAYGFPFPPLGERMSMLEEQVEIVHRLWTEDTVTFEGRHYRLDDCPALPKPLQQPRPPLILGGNAGPRAVALAVRFADEYNTLLASVDDCRQRRATLAGACEAAGRDPATLPLSLMATCAVGEDRADVLRRVRAILDVWGAGDDDPEAVLAERGHRWIAGTPAEVVERLGQLAEAGVTRVYLQHLVPADTEMVELVGEAVLPELSG